MSECPDIDTCKVMRSEDEYNFYCMEHWKDCYKHVERKLPVEWKAIRTVPY